MSRETKFSDTDRDRGKLIFLVQLTTSRSGNHTWLILILIICDRHTYIHTYIHIYIHTYIHAYIHTYILS